MDLPKNVFKQRLANKEKLIGSWPMSGSPTIAEAMGCVGFDYLVLDMEHVAIDVGMMISRANEYLAAMREQTPKAAGGY